MNSQMFDQLADDSFVALDRAVAALETLDAVMASDIDLDKEADPRVESVYSSLTEGAALESMAQTARNAIAKVIAIIRRVVDAVIDFLRSEQHSARKCIETADALISAASKITPGAEPKHEVTNMATMMMISFEGTFSRNVAKTLDTYYAQAVKFRKYIPTREIAEVISAVRSNKEPTIAMTAFHAKLQEGLEELGNIVAPSSSPMYAALDQGMKVYTSGRLFGDRFIFGQLSEIKDGTFTYNCISKRDNSTRMRVKSFKAVKPNDIALGAKTIRGFCEDFLYNLELENALFRTMREVTHLTRIGNERAGIKSLRAIANSLQNVYLVYMRHAMSVSRNMLNYLSDCVRAY